MMPPSLLSGVVTLVKRVLSKGQDLIHYPQQHYHHHSRQNMESPVFSGGGGGGGGGNVCFDEDFRASGETSAAAESIQLTETKPQVAVMARQNTTNYGTKL